MSTLQQIIDGLNRDLKTLSAAKVKNYLRNLSSIIKSAPQQAKIGYYCILAGIFSLLLQVILWVF